MHYFRLMLILFCGVLSLSAQEMTPEMTPAKLKVLYNSLDPTSISQHLAFYDLYSRTPEGQQALRDAYRLLSGGKQSTESLSPLPPALSSSIQAIVGLVNKHAGDSSVELSDTELAQIDTLANRLPNRQLAGSRALSEAEVMTLEPNQIDLARGVLLSQLGNDPAALRKIRSYGALIDLMALQILARIDSNASPKAKIRAINHFIFEEMGFRFPPHSSYAKDIDLYTFLPSVLDSRRGVCLGVSILYLCLAQRLNLDLEIVTPPGHIFVRWRHKDQEITIETTARGTNIPPDTYLGVDTRSLQQRNLKETIGLAHFNQAAVYWEREDYDKALASYLKAKPYLPNDKQLLCLMGYIYILQGNEHEAQSLMKAVTDYLPEFAVSKDTVAEDYLNGIVGADGIRAVFKRVDETRESLIEKRKALEDALIKYPRFREGIFSLAGTWLQLHRAGEAVEMLQRYHDLDPSNATVEYYLAALYAERMDYNNAWKHLHLAEKLTSERHHHPKPLLELRKELVLHCPD